MPDDAERPTIPFWFKLLVCALAVVGLFSIIKWAIAAVFGVIWVALIVVVILVAAYALRGAARRGPRSDDT